ncbi:hypothetical protein CVT26_003678 [Gymnopilus dilepis]|uniref:Uncharacterized protein n=1 Tax=Gymnopilus dilepis TaxID=231916 RepID=A0A409X1T1_9AGAR|nr:hypothetical protein CVT26_003678 [Gymnopilus dilepis]
MTGIRRNGINGSASLIPLCLLPSTTHLPPPSSPVAVLAPPSNEDVGLFKMSKGSDLIMLLTWRCLYPPRHAIARRGGYFPVLSTTPPPSPSRRRASRRWVFL